jgi:putative flippase GtrA
MSWRKRFIKGFAQYGQFNLIAVSNAAIDIGSLNVFLFIWPTENTWLLALFNSIAYILAILNSYFWNTRFTFRYHVEKGVREKVSFAIQAGLSLGINNLVFLLAIQGLGWFNMPMWLSVNISKGMSMFCSSTASFFFMKWFVFPEKEAE